MSAKFQTGGADINLLLPPGQVSVRRGLNFQNFYAALRVVTLVSLIRLHLRGSEVQITSKYHFVLLLCRHAMISTAT